MMTTLIILSAITYLAMGQVLPHTDYFDSITEKLHWINIFRTGDAEFAEFIDYTDF